MRSHRTRRVILDTVSPDQPLAPRVGAVIVYLVEGMDDRRLKERLLSCENGPFYRTDFSIAHRCAPLQFPEHTKESYVAGARMGAGIVECTVTFIKDAQLVCRHSECDLHTTTSPVLLASEFKQVGVRLARCGVKPSNEGVGDEVLSLDRARSALDILVRAIARRISHGQKPSFLIINQASMTSVDDTIVAVI